MTPAPAPARSASATPNLLTLRRRNRYHFFEELRAEIAVPEKIRAMRWYASVCGTPA